MKQGIYDRKGELFAYLEGNRICDLDGVQIGVRRGQVIYNTDDDKMWTIEGDGLYLDSGDAVGYIGSSMMHDE